MRFRLKTLILFVTFCSVIFAVLKMVLDSYLSEKEAESKVVRLVKLHGGEVSYSRLSPWWIIRVLGNKRYGGQIFDRVSFVTFDPNFTGTGVRSIPFDRRNHQMDFTVVASLGRLRYLDRLYLSRTNVRDGDLLPLADAHSLTDLWLGETDISDKSMPTVGSLHKLTILNLDHTLITDQGIKHLVALEKLSVLNLRGTKIGDEALESIVSLPSLTTLDISDTQISDKSVDKLLSMKKLQHLIVGSSIDTKGIERLRTKIPDVQVVCSRAAIGEVAYDLGDCVTMASMAKNRQVILDLDLGVGNRLWNCPA